jgi:hypothetical protein
MKVMSTANVELWLLLLLYQGLVLAPIECALAIITVSHTQIERLEKIQNEAIILFWDEREIRHVLR